MKSDEWKLLLESEADNELVLFSYAKALMDESRWKESAVAFGDLVNLNPDYALAWAFLARTRLQSGDRKGARDACNLGMPIALAQRHEVPADEIRAVLEELESEF